MTKQLSLQARVTQSITAGLILVMLAACTSLPRDSIPVEDIRRASIPGMSGVRAWGGQLDPAFQADLVASIEQEPPGAFPLDDNGYPVYHGLAVAPMALSVRGS